MTGRPAEAADVLQSVVLSDETLSSEERCWLLLDLGSVLEELAPVPGTGAAWAPMPHVKSPLPLPVVAVGAEGPSQTHHLTAEDCYRQAIAADDGVGEAHKRLADLLVASRGAEAGRAHFARAHELLPDDICCATHCIYDGAPEGGRAGLGPIALTSPLAAGSRRTEEAIAVDDDEGYEEYYYEERDEADVDGEAAVDGPSMHLTDLQVSLPPAAATPSKTPGSTAEDVDAKSLAAWAALAASSFERHGCVVLPSLLDAEQIQTLQAGVADAIIARSVVDLTTETRGATFRIHKALPVGDGSGDAATTATKAALDGVLSTIWPLLAHVLQVSEGATGEEQQQEEAVRAVPLLGCGFMAVDDGAEAQELHKDVHGSDRHGPVPVTGDAAAEDEASRQQQAGGGPRAISIQLQLSDTRVEASNGESAGSLEVLPGSHRPDSGSNGGEAAILRAVATSENVVPINVPPGTVTLYSSRLWHRGGSNRSGNMRTFCFLTLSEPGSPAPPGLIHTIDKAEIGRWAVGREGLEAVD